MTQPDFGFPTVAPRGLGWDRYPGVCGAEYAMTVDGVRNGIWVRHCGHPTANRPYFVQLPDGAILDRKFTRAAEAQAAAVSEWESRK